MWFWLVLAPTFSRVGGWGGCPCVGAASAAPRSRPPPAPRCRRRCSASVTSPVPLRVPPPSLCGCYELLCDLSLCFPVRRAGKDARARWFRACRRPTVTRPLGLVLRSAAVTAPLARSLVQVSPLASWALDARHRPARCISNSCRPQNAGRGHRSPSRPPELHFLSSGSPSGLIPPEDQNLLTLTQGLQLGQLLLRGRAGSLETPLQGDTAPD